MREFELIVTIVNRGFSDSVVKAAREAGAQGGTILHARGTGVHEDATFFGITIQPEKEVVLTLVPRAERAEIMRAICREAGLDTPGCGLSFSLPVSAVAGISHMGQEQA
ncbi:P-II family nitrogen regulator [Feifania hominis]|uniref:P-II family nitrogen regulator n=1 Tax=Feifania hominis TaxID=2763660 RepID=A0A926HTG6_9FIRM|nr:P-II family nitrogen regulator [Feifania hominis]MBC8535849.1 P-II family nitrogen regulator [Feifania hominis]